MDCLPQPVTSTSEAITSRYTVHHSSPPPLTPIHRLNPPDKDLWIDSKRLDMKSQIPMNRSESTMGRPVFDRPGTTQVQSMSLDNVGILQTFNKAMDTLMDKRLKDLEKERLQISFDVFDKWVEGNGTRVYRADNPNAVQQKAGWVMNQISSRDNVVEKICTGVIICTTCHVNHLKRVPFCTASERRMKPAYRPPASAPEQIVPFAGKMCPERGCNGVLMHKRCRGFYSNPVMHRWHNFNDAIILESLGIHDHPRPIKDCPDLATADLANDPSATHVPPPFSWKTSSSNQACPPSRNAKESGNNKSTKIIRSVSNPRTSETFLTDESTVDVLTDNVIRAGMYGLTMDVVGCLPDNVQRAMKSFSVKPGKQHITFSFPFMADIIHQTAQLSTTRSRALYQMTPMLLCDHSLNLVDGFDVVLTLASDLKSGSACVVLLTMYQSNTTEGIKQHYSSLLKTLLEGLPQDLLFATHFKLPTFVLLSDDIDPDAIATPLAETLMSVRAADFLATGANPNEVILGLKENVILPCIIARPYAFRLGVTDVTSKLPEQDTERFVALAQYLLSDKCSESELKKTNLLLKDPAFVPSVVRQFWALWGHELIAPKIFPVAKAIWDSGPEDASNKQAGNIGSHARSAEDFQSWRAMFMLKSSTERPTFKVVLQRLVKALKDQGPKTEDTELEGLEQQGSTSHCPYQAANDRNISDEARHLLSQEIGNTDFDGHVALPLFLSDSSRQHRYSLSAAAQSAITQHHQAADSAASLGASHQPFPLIASSLVFQNRMSSMLFRHDGIKDHRRDYFSPVTSLSLDPVHATPRATPHRHVQLLSLDGDRGVTPNCRADDVGTTFGLQVEVGHDHVSDHLNPYSFLAMP